MSRSAVALRIRAMAGQAQKRSIHYEYVSILRRLMLHLSANKIGANPACGATKLLGVRCIFDIGLAKTAEWKSHGGQSFREVKIAQR